MSALIRGRCPRCYKGAIFPSTPAGWLGLVNESCSVCGLRFLREAGYFLGAMYISYGLGVLTVLPVALILAIALDLSLVVVMIIALVQTVLSMPLFLRYSRIIWLHTDQHFDPR